MVSGAAAQISPQFDPRANSVIVCSTSLASRPPSGVNFTPNEGATDWMAANWPTFEGTVGSRTTPIRAMRGAISLSSSSHFVVTPYSKIGNPVMLPPGFAMLATNPAATGSATITNTIGRVRVACCNATTDGVEVAKMRSRGSAARPPILNLQITVGGPTQLLQLLKERPDARLRLWVVFVGVRHEHANSTRPFGLLCACYQRPRHRATD